MQPAKLQAQRSVIELSDDDEEPSEIHAPTKSQRNLGVMPMFYKEDKKLTAKLLPQWVLLHGNAENPWHPSFDKVKELQALQDKIYPHTDYVVDKNSPLMNRVRLLIYAELGNCTNPLVHRRLMVTSRTGATSSVQRLYDLSLSTWKPSTQKPKHGFSKEKISKRRSSTFLVPATRGSGGTAGMSQCQVKNGRYVYFV
jgi:hypothetical protein